MWRVRYETTKLPPVGQLQAQGGGIKFLEEKDALAAFKLAPATRSSSSPARRNSPNLEKPVQMSFDNKGRLWVACMPTYPHYRPGDPGRTTS